MACLTNAKRKVCQELRHKEQAKNSDTKKENSNATADSKKDCEKVRYKANSKNILRTKKKHSL